MNKIALDAGHGGTDPGGSGQTVKEKEINLAVVLKTQELLVAKGFDILLTRDSDKYIPENSRVKRSNEWGAELYVAVHCNSYITQVAHGIETWYYNHKLLAQQFQDALISRFPDHVDRGVKKAGFYVLKFTRCPAVLVEIEFLSNPQQEEFLKSNIENIASVLADVISNVRVD